MHIDVEKCPQCGRPSSGFCSDECRDKAIGVAKINAELNAHERMLESWMQTAMEDSEGAATLSDHYYRYKRDLQAFQADRPSLFHRKCEAAEDEYMTLLSGARYEKVRAEQEKNIAALEKAVARDQARDEAAAERKAEADRRAAERRAEAEQRAAERQAECDRRAQEKQDEIDRKVREQEERLRAIPFEMPSDHALYEGVHVLGPNGTGKTTLAQEFIIHHVRRPDCPSLVIVDPKGTLIDRVIALKTYDPKRLVIIDATHDFPAKLGLFVKPMNTNSKQLLAQAISTYKYILKAADFAFTPKQGILFNHLARLMFGNRGTITSAIEFLQEYRNNPSRFDLSCLPEQGQQFFRRDFHTSYGKTAEEVAVRLNEIDGNDTLRAMFNTNERRVDFFDCIQRGKIILVNTGMSLDPEASRIIGRYVIAMVLNAVYIRATMPSSTWRPTLLVCDEFQEFVDEAKTPELLRFPREFNFGTMMLHHNMYTEEITQGVRTAISTLTGVKFCARPKGIDRNYMANDFGCEPEYLSAQRRTDTHVRFASVQRDKYEEVVSVQIRKGNIGLYPKRTDADITEIHRLNTLSVHGPIAPEPEQIITAPTPIITVPRPIPTENIFDDEWGDPSSP